LRDFPALLLSINVFRFPEILCTPVPYFLAKNVDKYLKRESGGLANWTQMGLLFYEESTTSLLW
jgi:hypothetical protein